MCLCVLHNVCVCVCGNSAHVATVCMLHVCVYACVCELYQIFIFMKTQQPTSLLKSCTFSLTSLASSIQLFLKCYNKSVV